MVQDDYTEGCGRGHLHGSEEPLFSCREGHSVFCPFSELTSDPEPGGVGQPLPGVARPSQLLFETGSMVEVKGYGFGVVQWMGEMSGTETAGVELVSMDTSHTSSPSLCVLSGVVQ